MTNELFDKFLAALRSGQTQQACGYLTDNRLGDKRVPKYACALGVLSVVADHWNAHFGLWEYPDTALHGSAVLSQDLASKIMHMNECAKMSFAEIADELESRRSEFVENMPAQEPYYSESRPF